MERLIPAAAPRRGRPKTGGPLRRSWLTIRLRDDEYDAVIKAANARGKKVAAYARAVILRDSINTDSPKSS